MRPAAPALRESLSTILHNRAEAISPLMSDLIIKHYDDWLWLEQPIENVTGEIAEISGRQDNY